MKKLLLSILFFIFVSVTAFAQSKEGEAKDFEYKHEVFREKTIKQKDGTSKTEKELVERTVPGEELIGELHYKYLNDEPSKNIVFTLPLRKEFAYVEGSATDEKWVWFSVDDGKTFSRFDDLKKVDDKGKMRVATGNDITHLQWRMAKELQKGEEGTLKYHFIIR